MTITGSHHTASGVDTKSDEFDVFGNDIGGGVDAKVHHMGRFGNDSETVVIKPRPRATFDNYGFIRVRKRTLRTHRWTGSPRSWVSFDLVKAVRVAGKPRHIFVLGLGSQENSIQSSELCWFWRRALYRMTRHGLSQDQRRRLIAEMVGKGAKLPTPQQCQDWARGWRRDVSELAMIMQMAEGNDHAEDAFEKSLRRDQDRLSGGPGRT